MTREIYWKDLKKKDLLRSIDMNKSKISSIISSFAMTPSFHQIKMISLIKSRKRCTKTKTLTKVHYKRINQSPINKKAKRINRNFMIKFKIAR